MGKGKGVWCGANGASTNCVMTGQIQDSEKLKKSLNHLLFQRWIHAGLDQMRNHVTLLCYVTA